MPGRRRRTAGAAPADPGASATACRPSTAWRAARAGWRCWSSAWRARRSPPGWSTPASAATPRRAAARACRRCWRSTSRPTWCSNSAATTPCAACRWRMTQDNLAAMARAAKAAGARVLLVGMQVPPNYGRQYGDDFAAVFATVARSRRRGAGALPAQGRGRRARRRGDCSRPTASTRRRRRTRSMLGNVWPVLRPLLRYQARRDRGSPV